MVELFLQERGNSRRFRHYLETRALPQLQHDFEKAMFYGFKQEQAAASLMTGISLSLLKDRKARQWYMECIEISFRSNNLETLWRGHLNLAQHLAADEEIEGGLFHCNRARQLISTDLQEREPHERQWRQRHLRHPLMRIASLLPESELVADPFVSTVLEEIKKHPGKESRMISPSFFSDKIIFLRDQSNEFYPYGG
jgi:hypothetical protein